MNGFPILIFFAFSVMYIEIFFAVSLLLVRSANASIYNEEQNVPVCCSDLSPGTRYLVPYMDLPMPENFMGLKIYI